MAADLVTLQELLAGCKKVNDNKILVIVIDGLGGCPHPDYGNKSELEFARLPNLDAFVQKKETVLGMIDPVARGIIPGSAAGHFGLFGYDPFDKKHHIGRGILEAIDLDLPVKAGDIVARINVATLKDGKVTDRRAQRTNSAPLLELVEEKVSIDGATVRFIPTREHRGVMWIKDAVEPLNPAISDTDPGENGKPVAMSKPKTDDPVARKTADIINDLNEQIVTLLAGREPGNCVLMRGFSTKPGMKPLSELHALNCLAIADYPLYRGLAKLMGMEMSEPVVPLKEKVSQLQEGYRDGYTFFFMHYKTPDSKGEDANFPAKVEALEAFDAVLPEILDIMNGTGDVVALTGDHSTPSIMGAHSYHCVPLALFNKSNRSYEKAESFDERACLKGIFGRIKGTELMSCLLSRAGKLKKFDL